MTSFRYFTKGLCQAGDNCPYGHDLTLSNKGTLPCRFFATGTCAYGDKCRFSHGDNLGSNSGASNPATKNATTAKPSSSSTATTSNASSSNASLNPNAATWAPKPSTSSSSWASAAEFVPKSQMTVLSKSRASYSETSNEESTGKHQFAMILELPKMLLKKLYFIFMKRGRCLIL